MATTYTVDNSLLNHENKLRDNFKKNLLQLNLNLTNRIELDLFMKNRKLCKDSYIKLIEDEHYAKSYLDILKSKDEKPLYLINILNIAAMWSNNIHNYYISKWKENTLKNKGEKKIDTLLSEYPCENWKILKDEIMLSIKKNASNNTDVVVEIEYDNHNENQILCGCLGF